MFGLNKLAKLRRHASCVHFALIHFGKIHFKEIHFGEINFGVYTLRKYTLGKYTDTEISVKNSVWGPVDWVAKV